MIRLGKEKPELNVVCDQHGTPTYAAELAQAIVSILDYSKKTKTFRSGIYHYTNEGITSWFEFTEKIHQLAGITTCTVHPIPTDQYPTKAKRPMYSVLDKTKIKETFGIEIPDWEKSLEKCIQVLG
jgi:dTDP-4-dehydrorhamnose reductase